MSKPTSSLQLKALGEGPASHAFAMLTDLLGRLTGDPDVHEILNDALAWIKAAFSVDFAVFFMLDTDAQTLVQAEPYALTGIDDDLTPHINLPEDAARAMVAQPRQALSLGPAGQHDWTLTSFIPPVNDAADALRWGAIASLWRGDRILGAVLLAKNADTPFSQVELLTLAQMAGCLAMTLDHAVVYRELVEETFRYQTLILEAPDAMTLYDPELDRFLNANTKAEELFGMSREELMTAIPESLCGGALTLALSMAELDMDSSQRATLGAHEYEIASSQITVGEQTAVMSTYRRVSAAVLQSDGAAANPQKALDLNEEPARTSSALVTSPYHLLDEGFDDSFGNEGRELVDSTDGFSAIREEVPDSETEYRTQNGSDQDRWIICRELPELKDKRDEGLEALNFLPGPSDIHNPFEDRLTRLASGALFQNRLEHCLKRARRNDDVRYAVILVNLDCFNIVNKRFGQFAGDKVLFETARRIESALRNTDTAARLSNDEFALLLENHTDASHALFIANRLLGELSTPFNIRSYELFLTASIGVTTSDVGYLLSEHVIQDVRTSMHRAKRNGGGAIEVFNTTVLDTPTLMLDIEKDLGLKRPAETAAGV